jgi:hypothetical protein
MEYATRRMKRRRTPKRHAALLKKRREPTSRNDPIIALIADYFYPCKVFHNDVHAIGEIWAEDTTDDAVGRLLLVYIYHWVSSLWVVAHAFRDVLKLQDKSIIGIIDQHFKELSDFRNATYHYHRTPAKHLQFFSLGKLNWAEELHSELERYFSDYLTLIKELDDDVPF